MSPRVAITLPSNSPMLIFLQGLHVLACLLPVGALLTLRLVLGQADMTARLRSGLLLAQTVAALTLLVWLGATAAQVTGAPTPLTFALPVLRLVLGTRFGLLWLLRLGLLAMLVATTLWSGQRSGALARILLWSVLLLLTLALGGHAAAEGDAHPLLPPVMSLHLLAAAAWLGSLPLLAARLAAAGPSPQLLRRYARYGYVCVGALLVSGAILAATLLGGSWPAAGGEYRHLLTIKLALVAGMLTFAAVNRWVLGPRLARTGLRLCVAAEFVFGCLVVTAAVALSQAAPM